MTNYEIKVDWENDAARWWSAGFAARNRCPKLLRPIFDGWNAPDRIVVTDAEIEEIRMFCASLPSWNDGPAHAPTALIIRELDPHEAAKSTLG